MKKTTVELPDGLVREIRLRAAGENRRLRELVPELLRRALAEPEARPGGELVGLPVLHFISAVPGESLTPEKVSDILRRQEIDWFVRQ